MKTTIKTLTLVTGYATSMLFGAEFYVSTKGDDRGTGTEATPFKTITKASERAQPGDTIKVLPGVYRERVDPPRGGTSDQNRITYEAVGDVTLKGSEVAKGWENVENDVWKLTLENGYFGEFNPFNDLIKGDWYESRQPYHTGAVFLNGHWLRQAANKGMVFGKEALEDKDQDLVSLQFVLPAGMSSMAATSAKNSSRDFTVINSDRGEAGVGPLKAGDWLAFEGIDFGAEGTDTLVMNTGSPVGGALIEIREGDHTGPLLGTLDALLTAEWTLFQRYQAKLSKKLTGKHNISIVVKKRPVAPEYGKVIGRWFAEVDETRTTIFADFKGKNPNEELVEINKRQTVFYPTEDFVNYITVKGFTMEHAATPWSPPTAEQIGLIGTNWSKGWVIEDNTVRYSVCTGITLGKHGDEYDNTYNYFRSITEGLKYGWNKETIGSHVVRNNHVHDCGQAGMVGSLGSAFCLIEDNTIHHITKDHRYGGCETAGIKFHGAVDTIIRNNHIYECEHWGGLWLDWMCQGSRVTGNLLHDNANDLMCEMNHGPMLVDNNFFLSEGPCLLDASGGAAYVHNVFGGHIRIWHYLTNRRTPYFKPHSTDVVLYEESELSHFGAFDGNVVVFEEDVLNTENDHLYQTVRYGMTKYLLDVPAGAYTVTLQFNDPVSSVPGGRVFDVSLDGKIAIPSLDVFAQAGKNTAYDHAIKHHKTDEKPLEITFNKITGDTIISGILITGKTKAGVDFQTGINCAGKELAEHGADTLIKSESGVSDFSELPPNYGKTVIQDDERYLNNIFLGGDALSSYDEHDFKIKASGNLYGGNSKATKREENATVDPNLVKPIVSEEEDGWYLSYTVNPEWLALNRQVLTSEDFGQAELPQMNFEDTDGSPYVIDTDYLGKPRDSKKATVGALQVNELGAIKVKVRSKG